MQIDVVDYCFTLYLTKLFVGIYWQRRDTLEEFDSFGLIGHTSLSTLMWNLSLCTIVAAQGTHPLQNLFHLRASYASQFKATKRISLFSFNCCSYFGSWNFSICAEEWFTYRTRSLSKGSYLQLLICPVLSIWTWKKESISRGNSIRRKPIFIRIHLWNSSV